ncbi:hypothetical protein G6F56_005987 [Rhizopus delemar]|nr:hypothetical protein G6F56_005987 [Rhizopus delemar]
MSKIFIYEDRHGNAVDENGDPEPMDYIVDQNEFIVETIATHTEYLGNAVPNESSLTYSMLEKLKNEDVYMKEAKPKRDYVRYTVQDKVRFFDLKIEKCMTAAAAAKQLGIHPRTAYRWASQYNTCPDGIFDSCKRVGRKCILTEEHKTTVINFIDANPSATVAEVTEHLLKRFHDLKVSCSTVNNSMRAMHLQRDKSVSSPVMDSFAMVTQSFINDMHAAVILQLPEEEEEIVQAEPHRDAEYNIEAILKKNGFDKLCKMTGTHKQPDNKLLDILNMELHEKPELLAHIAELLANGIVRCKNVLIKVLTVEAYLRHTFVDIYNESQVLEFTVVFTS